MPPEDGRLLREWLLVLRGDGRSTKTLDGYRASLRLLCGVLAEGSLPVLTAVTAEHLREWLTHLRERGNKPATVNTRYRAANGFFKWLVGGVSAATTRWTGSRRRGCPRLFRLTTRQRRCSEC
jgi:site-specific recombinase XerD